MLQSMGTCYCVKYSYDMKLENAKQLYELAEDCYRWLGDARGLADTLDYFGHLYHEFAKRHPDRNEKYHYMAQGKWKESSELWRIQENKEKLEAVQKKLQILKNYL